MTVDIKYNCLDNELDSFGGNYAYVAGAYPKVARLVVSGYTKIDGTPFGNRAWADLARATDDSQNRQLLERYTLEAVQPLIDSGEIRDVKITIDSPSVASGRGVMIEFYDVNAGLRNQVSTVAPWAKV